MQNPLRFLSGTIVCMAALLALPIASPVAAEPNAPGKLVITVKPGTEWMHTFKIAHLFAVKTTPQMAFWIENASGAVATTLYVTRRTALQDWKGVGEIKRPTALPLWVHKHSTTSLGGKASCDACHGIHKSKNKTTTPPIDAITGATPMAGFTHEYVLPQGILPGAYVVRAEINQSMDYNAVYKEDAKESDPSYTAHSGQPSILWEGTIKIGSTPSQSSLKPVGHSEPAGKTSRVVRELDTLTTARNIVQSIDVRFTP